MQSRVLEMTNSTSYLFFSPSSVLMTEFQGSVVTLVIWLLPAIIILRAIIKSRTSSNLPPGPPRLPIIGHLHLLAPIPHQALQKLSIRYGPVFHIYLGSKPCVVISSPEMAKELLKTHEASCSNRPESIASEYLSYHSQDFSFAPYGPYWKFVKKLCMSELLSGQSLDLLHTVRRYEIESMVKEMLQKATAVEPVDVGCAITRITNNVISSMIMSKRCSDTDDEAGEMRKMVKEISKLLGEFNISDYIWFCKYLDLQGVKRRLVDVRRRYDILTQRIIDERRQIRRKRQLESIDAQKDFLDLLLDMYEDDSSEFKLNMDKIKAIILDLFTTGTEAVANVTEWGLAELINHPIIMEKARQEIDTVVGKSRLVQESDIVNLPYLQAIVKETLRLHAASPLIPRESSEDCTIGNYHIPAKTNLLVHVWALGRDENQWENALEFKPERFVKTSSEDGITGSGQVDFRGRHFQLLPFGSGKRACPGTSLSLKVIQSTIAAMIQCFDWNVQGGEGNNSTTTVNMDEGKALVLERVYPLICVPVARLNPFPSV